MARKLKTFVTSLGFFEQAVAAPSMKAALEAWGVPQNLFHQGFAKETDDPEIVAAATARPGTVLKRAVGTTGAFTENPALPENLPPKARPDKVAKKRKAPAKAVAKSETDRRAGRAQLAAFDKTRAKRERERATAERRRATIEARAAEKRAAAAAKAHAALDNAKAKHDAKLAALDRQQAALERKIDAERKRWHSEKAKLERRLRDAGR
ncbi:MAG: cell envelope biogenesis protein TolA [Alphaproteobacteria bacterium]